jgi:hypothetical protein
MKKNSHLLSFECKLSTILFKGKKIVYTIIVLYLLDSKFNRKKPGLWIQTINFGSGSDPSQLRIRIRLPGHFGSGSRSDRKFGSGRIRIHNTVRYTPVRTSQLGIKNDEAVPASGRESALRSSLSAGLRF